MSSWTQFFRDAGIPSSVAKGYALTFEDNRISKDMLLDLNKEILNDMGIKVMGDVISILKHAKKVHSQESRRSEIAGSSSTSGGVKPSSSKVPLAHSTTPGGQGPTVSTTSVAASAARRSKALGGELVSDIPADSWTTEVYAGESLRPRASYQDTLDLERVDTTVQPLNIHSTLRSDNMELEYVDNADGIPASNPFVRQPYDDQPLEQYTTAAYESRQKRPLTLYSDEIEFSPPKHPRVITVPNESQDIYTTTALQNAAAIVAAVESQKMLAAAGGGGGGRSVGGGGSREGEGSPISERNRRLLEAAGLVPPQQRERTTSVFSRLDRNPSSSSIPHTSPPIPRSQPIIDTRARITTEAVKPRRIRLTKSATSIRETEPTLPERSVTTPVLKVLTTSGQESKSTLSSRFTGRLGGKKQQVPVSIKQSTTEGILASEYNTATTSTYPTTVKVGIRKKDSSSKMSERLGVRSKGNMSERIKLSGKERNKESVSVGLKASRPTTKLKIKTTQPSSMVADEYEYQTKRQMDIRSRLEKKELEKKARRKGLLPGRLGQHHVFGRLE